MSVRVRYAPSPTGLQHIGGVRTALFNYFFARARGGTFVLRIEDTDRERYNDESLQDIYDTFAWLGIHWDEGPDVGGAYGPYVQSERIDLYQEYAKKLVDAGWAYHAYDPPEELEELKQKSKEGYDRRGRNRTPGEIEELKARGVEPVVRFKGPLEGDTVFEDVVLGRVKRRNKDIPPDPVLLKSDGFPTYHLANVIDDHLMGITHILRAQEWLSSGALHVLLYKAFGWEPPAYCHLPIVTGKDGQKLSKRHGATSAREFWRQGYLPEAIINYVSLLGWSYDDSREFFTLADLEQLFTLEKINKAPAVFDYKKLDWFNGNYIREKDDAELRAQVLPFLQEAGLVADPPTPEQEAILDGAVPLIRERLKKLSDAPDLTRFLFGEIDDYPAEELLPKKTSALETRTILDATQTLLDGIDARTDEENEELFRAKAEELDVKVGNVLMPLRVAVTGSKVSPPLFSSIRLLGADTTRARVQRALERVRALAAAETGDAG
ncbi:MAG: glutamate--tRNA ligase [Spirochaetota bacterium]